MKRFLVAIIVLSMSGNVFAQKEKFKERLRAQKVGFITEKLQLTADEAEAFWPIYNAFEKTMYTLRRKDMKAVRKAMHGENLSETEANTALTRFMEVEEEMHQHKKQLVKDLRAILPPQKIIKLKVAEDAFNRLLMDKLRERHRRNEGGGPKPLP